MGQRLFILALILLSLFIIFRPKNTPTPTGGKSIKTTIGTIVYNLEIAATEPERAQGLSGRSTLCPTCGMLFIFDKEGIYPFWMKDTLIPLDMIWLDGSGKIVSMTTAQPQPGAKLWELKTYPNTSPAKYVIELNAGDFLKNNLKLGQIIAIPKL